MPNNKIKVAIISGGLSSEREISLKTGKEVFKNLSSEAYDKFMIEMTADGRWLLQGNSQNLQKKGNHIKQESKSLTIMPADRAITKNDLRAFDVVFLALHGKYGEDGKIQSLLDLLDIPYTGSGVLASALGMNKEKTLNLVSGLGVRVPKFIIINSLKASKIVKVKEQVRREIGYPCVVKPNESGSSIGITIVKKPVNLKAAIKKAFREDRAVLIEEFIEGREITCGILGNSNNGKLQALPPVEVIVSGTFFDYNAKYFSKKTKEICPADITSLQKQKVQYISKRIHEALGCDGLSRSDFRFKGNEYYFLEINTLPGLTAQSLCPKEARVAGMTFAEFLDKQVKLALKKD